MLYDIEKIMLEMDQEKDNKISKLRAIEKEIEILSNSYKNYLKIVEISRKSKKKADIRRFLDEIYL